MRWHGPACMLALLLGPTAPLLAQDDATTRRAAALIRQLELPSRRAAAADRLLALGPAAVPQISRALRDPRPEVVERLVLALAVLGADAPPAVPVLRELSAADDPAIACAARWALAPFEPRGVLVAADCTSDSILELDDEGNELHRLALEDVWGVELLPGGRYLATVCGGDGSVLELDRGGAVHWRFDAVTSPVYAMRLPSDHTLIVDSSGNRVLEVDRAGAVVWSEAADNPSSAIRRPDGTTLIAEFGGNALRCVDRAGDELWRREEPGQPIDLRCLADGGTLVALYGAGELIERDAAGELLLRAALPGAAESAVRLPDGSTLAAGDGWLVRLDATGRELARFAVGRLTTIRHY